MNQIVKFDDQRALDQSLVGGKGVNLARLTVAEFPVPQGFVLTTTAYDDFVEATGLRGEISHITTEIDYADPEQLDRQAAEIRRLIADAVLPSALSAAISASYAELGGDPFVAVRSSGTAEDLAESSFAGLHDTYLDVQGTDDVVQAVKRCWGSLWTARATSYRHTKGIEHDGVSIAIVVQTMIPSEVSGVLFTGNPMTTATDEIVINASYGLGEGIVSGILTPDTITLRTGTLKVIEKVLGDKLVQVVRDPVTGRGTATVDVPPGDRSMFSLTDTQAAELGALGRQVQDYYSGFPQDIEWGFAGGKFYLLQSRDVTGVEFSWDADVDAWQELPDDDQYVWTRAWSDQVWTGAITPLMFSFRARCHAEASRHSHELWGLDESAQTRMWKFYKAEAYVNSKIDQVMVRDTVLPALRPGLVYNLPTQWRDDVIKARFSLGTYLRMHARIISLEPGQGINAWMNVLDDYMYNRTDEADGIPDEQLSLLSDAELRRETFRAIAFEGKYISDVWTGFFQHASVALGLLGVMLAKWYTGVNPAVFTDLLTGVPERTVTMEENIRLWHLALRIRSSKTLTETYHAKQNGAFFEALEETEEGRTFLEDYRSFLHAHPHRGHADRDIYYPRRCEDPSIDYRAFGAFLSADADSDPEAKEHEINLRREGVLDEVANNLRSLPFGSLRAELFKMLMKYIYRFLMIRDNERHFVDRTTMTIKRCLLEVNRRLTSHGLFETPRDFYFLTIEELFDYSEGRANSKLVHAKIHARQRDFDRFDRKETIPPPYIHKGRGIDFDQLVAPDDSDGVLRGIGTSRGQVTGRARVVRELKNIGVVRSGEILVTNSTDPGWTPVFLVIKGIVLETGGLLAHGSCLAREYGFPAVQIGGAMTRIPDGALISVNGDTGEVVILENPESETPALEGALAKSVTV
jgi:phosphohistidine swiveling domain-containing protein